MNHHFVIYTPASSLLSSHFVILFEMLNFKLKKFTQLSKFTQ